MGDSQLANASSFFEENGDGDSTVIIKTDQETSVGYLVEDIIDARKEGRTVIEESPVQSSGSNGVVERGVQEIEGGIRALLLGLQERIKRKIDARERIISFMPEYAAYLANRFNQGEDGKVPYERIKRKEAYRSGNRIWGAGLVQKEERIQDGNTQPEMGIFDFRGDKKKEQWSDNSDRRGSGIC